MRWPHLLASALMTVSVCVWASALPAPVDPGNSASSEERAFDNAALALALQKLGTTFGSSGEADAEGRAQVFEFGRSAAGRPLLAVQVSAGAQRRHLDERRPLVLLWGQEGGGDSAGARALLGLAQSAVRGELNDVLAAADLLIVPRLNPDGADTGMTGNADGMDVEADHLLLRTPESRALAALVHDQAPAVVLNLRTLQPAMSPSPPMPGLPGPDVVITPATVPGQPYLVGRATREWLCEPAARSLQADRASLPLEPWERQPPRLACHEGGPMGKSGVARNAFALRNLVSLALTVRSDLPQHDEALRRAALIVLKQAGPRLQDIMKVEDFVRREVSSQSCDGEVLVGEPSVRLARPCGYWLSATAYKAVQRLSELGVQVQQLGEDVGMLGQRYLVEKGTDEQERQVRVVPSLLDMPKGSYYVSLAQPLANLVVSTLEPAAPDSYVADGIVPDLDKIARVTRRLDQHLLREIDADVALHDF